MTDINHRRKNKLAKNLRRSSVSFNNGYGCWPDEPEQRGSASAQQPVRGNIQRGGNSDQLDKSMHGWSRKSEFSDKHIGAFIGNDFANGSRGMAKSVKGAKKFVRTRIRFHEKATLDKMLKDEKNLVDGEG